jgi:hypothetical protein
VKRIIAMLMAVLGMDTKEEESRPYSAEEIGTIRPRRGNTREGQQPRDLTVERAAEIIDELPSEVPRESALRIVQGTLGAVGIEVYHLERCTRTQVAELTSEVELARNRQQEFQEKTEETVRSLQEELRKAREACDVILTEEERKISRASAALQEARRVRAFFDFPNTDGEENIECIDEDTQPLGVLETQVRRSSDPPTATDRTAH